MSAQFYDLVNSEASRGELFDCFEQLFTMVEALVDTRFIEVFIVRYHKDFDEELWRAKCEFGTAKVSFHGEACHKYKYECIYNSMKNCLGEKYLLDTLDYGSKVIAKLAYKIKDQCTKEEEGRTEKEEKEKREKENDRQNELMLKERRELYDIPTVLANWTDEREEEERCRDRDTSTKYRFF